MKLVTDGHIQWTSRFLCIKLTGIDLPETSGQDFVTERAWEIQNLITLQGNLHRKNELIAKQATFEKKIIMPKQKQIDAPPLPFSVPSRYFWGTFR